MVKKIPHTFINELLEHTNIVNLIQKKVKLKKKGKNFYANCPFHKEKTPSFTVNKEKQFYHCFGCGSHGNAINFIMNYEKLKFIESIEELANQCNIKIPYKKMYEKNHEKYLKKKKLYQLIEKLCIFYQMSLKNKISEEAYQYLKIRGINETIITRFSIGFAPTGWNNIIKYFGNSIENKILFKDIGMLVINEKGQSYDRFRKRIMFPIRDIYGRIIAFGGRTLGNEKPKYLNSPETEIFHKNCQLYGLYETKSQYSKLSKILIVEGYIDVISLAQFDINYAVASLGTFTTINHIKLLYHVTDDIICCYDGDHAGRIAAWNTLKNALSYLNDDRKIRFIFLPEGEDPDTLIRKIGKKEFEKLINKAIPFSKFLFETLIKQVDLSILEGRIKLSRLALPLIKKIPGELLSLYLRKELSKKIGILDDNFLEKFLIKRTMKTKVSPYTQIKRTNMRILIGLLIQYPYLSSIVPKKHGLEKINKPGILLFIKLVQIIQSKPGLTKDQLLIYYKKSQFFSQLETLSNWNHMISNEMIEETFIDTLINLYNSILKNRQEKLISLDRTKGITFEERKEIWFLNKTLTKKIE